MKYIILFQCWVEELLFHLKYSIFLFKYPYAFVLVFGSDVFKRNECLSTGQIGGWGNVKCLSNGHKIGCSFKYIVNPTEK